MTDNIEIKWKWLNEEKKYKVYEDGRIYSEYSDKFIKPYCGKKISNMPLLIKMLISFVQLQYNTRLRAARVCY
jgi:hypothetical protein